MLSVSPRAPAAVHMLIYIHGHYAEEYDNVALQNLNKMLAHLFKDCALGRVRIARCRVWPRLSVSAPPHTTACVRMFLYNDEIDLLNPHRGTQGMIEDIEQKVIEDIERVLWQAFLDALGGSGLEPISEDVVSVAIYQSSIEDYDLRLFDKKSRSWSGNEAVHEDRTDALSMQVTRGSTERLGPTASAKRPTSANAKRKRTKRTRR